MASEAYAAPGLAIAQHVYRYGLVTMCTVAISGALAWPGTSARRRASPYRARVCTVTTETYVSPEVDIVLNARHHQVKISENKCWATPVAMASEACAPSGKTKASRTDPHKHNATSHVPMPEAMTMSRDNAVRSMCLDQTTMCAVTAEAFAPSEAMMTNRVCLG